MIIEIILGIIIGIALILFSITLGCFLKTFYSPKRKPLKENEFRTAKGEIYEPYRPQMIAWMKDLRTRPHENFSIVSFDGLTLRGKYYECKKGAPIELMFHGYRSTAEQDLCGGVQRCFDVGHNAFIVDQRGAGSSDGHVVSFGINEHKDCLRWIDFLIEHFGNDVNIILTGISMGAATVLTAAGKQLPDNVIFILSDCTFSTPKDIIQKVIVDMKLPPVLAYHFIKFAAQIFGKFDLEETSPLHAMKTCKKPVIFYHGTTDAYVPCEMSQTVYEACHTHKKLVLVDGAGHGLSCMLDNDGYLNALKDFEKECMENHKKTHEHYSDI